MILPLLDCASDFDLEHGQYWFNTASEGPIPLLAKKALEETIYWKLSPHRLTIPMFQRVPIDLKHSLGALLKVNPADIILGNSATYGLHLLANGLNFKQGDDIILMANDFPTDILPWLSLIKEGIIVRQIKPLKDVLTLAEIKHEIKPQTKVICLPHVHSFSGHMLEIEAIGQYCQSNNIIFIVNIAQTAGVVPLDINTLNVDAVVGAGYKWLLGPYGTGFCWIKSALRESLNYPQNYWISLMDEKSLSSNDALTLNDDHSSRRYDVFGTANFFNNVPWRASIELLLGKGITNVYAHNQALIKYLVDHLNKDAYQLICPLREIVSPILVFSCNNPLHNRKLHQFLLAKQIYLAFWKNNLRFSPHLFNTQRDVQYLMGALDEFVTSVHC